MMGSTTAACGSSWPGRSPALLLSWFALQSKEARRAAAVAETTQFTIGANVSCTDGPCGEVRRLIVDPGTDTVTHLVVEPGPRRGQGRLVPVGLVDTSTGQIRLRCTKAEFENLDPAEETRQLPVDLPETPVGYDPGLSVGRRQYVTGDSIPVGENEVGPGEHVHATDGYIGQVQGFAIDPDSHHVTHVLLREGHLWGRKEVAIPITAVTGVDDGIRLSITKQQVQDLPPADIDNPGG
jgi:sporulation protein YlmC with PRC-barrel domain